MNDKEKQEKATEPILDFEKAKDLTVGQAFRKSEEIEAGVTDEDSVLDKYIKQHREEILAGKFDTVHQAPESTKEQENSETFDQDEATKDEPSEIKESKADKTKPKDPKEPVTIIDPLVTSEEIKKEENSSPSSSQPVFTSDVAYQWDNEIPFYKRKSVLYSSLSVLALLVIGGTIYWNMRQDQKTTSPSPSSSQQAKSSSSFSSSGSSVAEKVKAFDDLYASFFTDDQQTILKNSEFGKLDQLKTALAALEGSADYEGAKNKYDSLVQQVSAVQAVNSQFETPAITDGVLDTRAKVKSDANFTDPNTSNEELNKVLTAAISQGRTQQQNSVADQGVVEAPSEANASVQQSPATVQSQPNESARGNTNGVVLQRNLSRVPYNQAAIDDVTNPAWTFNPGILENILSISRQRGYIVGDQYILERVNIINGNGYYNLFKPDGTYLFSINCKTGYFVGNAKGHADSLDY